jgi:hypothetical protein
MVKKYKITDILITMLLLTHIFSWVLFMPMAQIQMMFFGKRIFSFIHYGIIEILLLLILVLHKKGKIHLDSFGKKALLIMIPFFISWIVNIAVVDSLTPFVIMFYLMNWIFPFLIIIVINQYAYDVTPLLKFMLIIVLIHALIIFYQRFTNTTFWPFTSYDDGKTIFEADTYYNIGNRMVRCPGLCLNGLDAGILLIFGIILTTILTKIKKYIKIIIYIFFSISIYFTGTRNVFVMLLFIVGVSFLMMQKITYKKKIRLLILVTIISCFAYLYFIMAITTFETTGNLFTDTTSIGIRLEKWIRTINKISTGGICKIIFGVMGWQNAGNCEVIDNMYLELVYCSGIFSLIAYVKYIFDISILESKDNNYISFICSGFTLSYCVYGVLNSTSNFYLTLIVLLLIYCNDKKGHLKKSLDISVKRN